MRSLYVVLVFCGVGVASLANSQTWTKIGTDINGSFNQNAGNSVSINGQGDRIAIAYPSMNQGLVRVFDNISGTWTQVGADIVGEASGDKFGYAISLSKDGKTIAIGAPENDGTAANAGHARIYKLVAGVWTKLGADIDGPVADGQLGKTIAINSNGNRVLIGAPQIGASNQGQARIYYYTGSAWALLGNPINGDGAGDLLASSVDISEDGTTIALGIPGYDGAAGSNTGLLRVFMDSLSNWVKVGMDLEGRSTVDNFGTSVSINSDGSVVACGGPQISFGNDSSYVRVYENIAGNWTQIGNDIEGEVTGDQSGVSLNLNSAGTVVAIGASKNDDAGTDAGHVRIYQNNFGKWALTGFDIDGEAAGDLSGSSVHLNSLGDTVIIGAPNNTGGGVMAGHARVYGTSICFPTQISGSLTVCDSYTVPSGDETYTTSGFYQDTILNKAGCDSILNITLTINYSSSSVINITECDHYTSPSGANIYTTSGNYLDTIGNSSGCDSIITINLVINNSSNSNITVEECNEYTVPSGDETYTASGIYSDTVVNSAGCDSIITIDLTIHSAKSTNINPVACNNYTSASGETLTSSGTYIDSLFTINGCDSIVTMNLTINTANDSIMIMSDSLIAEASGATYVWLDCNNNYSVVSGFNDRTFQYAQSGSYAVVVSENGCVDTSDCIEVIKTGIDLSYDEVFQVYPNPGKGEYFIDFNNSSGLVRLTLFDYSGKKVLEESFDSSEIGKFTIDGQRGFYFAELIWESGETKIVKIVKE